MQLQPYVESIQQQLLRAADAGSDEARALAERLVAPLEAAARLAFQDALGAAAEEITLDLAPGSVEVRLRGRDPEFVVTWPALEVAGGERGEGVGGGAASSSPPAGNELVAPGEADEGGTARINLRLPEHLKARVEIAARGEGLSVNTWLVRATAAALRSTDTARSEPRSATGGQRYSGWVR